MKKISLLMTLAAVLFVAASCSKEKRVENRLSSKGGKWMITKQTSNLGVGFGSFGAYGGISNAGYMIFAESGEYTWAKTYDDTTQVLTGTWTNTQSDVKVMMGSEELTFHIKDGERKEMRLELNMSVEDTDGNAFMDVLTFQMKKN